MPKTCNIGLEIFGIGDFLPVLNVLGKNLKLKLFCAMWPPLCLFSSERTMGTQTVKIVW